MLKIRVKLPASNAYQSNNSPGTTIPEGLAYTVAQKTAQVFACFWKIALLWDDDVIQGPEIFTQKSTTS